MDASSLAKLVVENLAPAIPFLVKAGESATASVIKDIGVSAWQKSVSVWSKIKPEFNDHPKLKEAIQEVADDHLDKDAQAMLRLQLKKVLMQNPMLLDELSRLVQNSDFSTNASASGKGSVVAGESINNSTIITGKDNNINLI
jgi:histone deacetylase complex regulatory component SIN3